MPGDVLRCAWGAFISPVDCLECLSITYGTWAAGAFREMYNAVLKPLCGMGDRLHG